MEPGITEMEVATKLRQACAGAGGQGAWAERHGVTAAYVSSVLHAKQAPGPRILAALGLRKVARFVELDGR